MSFSAISALSPLDGRYASRLAKLRPIMSELGYMQRRLQVELAWLVALSDAGFREFAPLTLDARRYLSALVLNFSEADGEAIKAIEKTTRQVNARTVRVELPLSRTMKNNAEAMLPIMSKMNRMTMIFMPRSVAETGGGRY
jgi:adenylosuccinate lyase